MNLGGITISQVHDHPSSRIIGHPARIMAGTVSLLSLTLCLDGNGATGDGSVHAVLT